MNTFSKSSLNRPRILSGGKSREQLGVAVGLDRRLNALEQTVIEGREASEQLSNLAEKLDKQMARAGKEQFKANTLAETVQATLKTGLEQLRDVEVRRERDLADLRAKLSDGRQEGRLSVLQSLLPVLDGLQHVLEAAHSLRPGQTPRVRIGQQLVRFWRGLFGAAKPVGGPTASLAAWVEGVVLTEQRLLALLAKDGIRPLTTPAEAFDPNLHVAVEVAPATELAPHGTVVRELRRGYLLHGELLRYADVAVARDLQPPK